MSSGLIRINQLDSESAQLQFLNCCGSRKFALFLELKRPYRDLMALEIAMSEIEAQMSTADWFEAFSAHPQIGSKKVSANETQKVWSEKEQQGVSAATDEVKRELRVLNESYFKKFGFIFLICATGLTAEEMLEALRERVWHSKEIEIKTACEEQKKITRIRLGKLLNPE